MPADERREFRVLPRLDRDAAAVAVGRLAARAERDAARSVDHAAGGEIGTETRNRNHPALRDERLAQRYRGIGAVIDEQSRGAQRCYAAERELAARGVGLRHGRHGAAGERTVGVGRPIINGETQAAAGRGDFPFNVEIRRREIQRATRGHGERRPGGHGDVAVAVVDRERAEAVGAEQGGREGNAFLSLVGQRRDVRRKRADRCGGGACLKRDRGRRGRIGRVKILRQRQILALKHQRQRAHRRRDFALPRAGDGCAAQAAVERHRGRGDRERAAVAALHIAGLVVRGKLRIRGRRGRAPLRVARGRGAGVDAVVNAVGRGLRDVDDAAVGEQLRRLDVATHVVDPAAGNVDRRSGLQHDRTARLQIYRAAVGREFANGVVDERDVASGVRERRADPRLAVISAGLAEVDLDGLAAQGTVALERRVGEFGAAQLHRDDVFGDRRGHSGRAGDVDGRAGVEINLPASEREIILRGRAGAGEVPGARADVECGARREQCGFRCEINGLSFEVELRRQRELRTDDTIGACEFGHDLGDAVRTERDRAGGLWEKRRESRETAAAHCVVAGEQINAAVERHRSGARNGAELIDRFAGE